MENILNEIAECLLPKHDIYLYFFLFFSAVFENLFPPVPGDTITAFGAFLVGTGRLNYFLVYLSTSIGSVFGFMFLFSLGKYFGRKFFHEKNYRYFPIEKIEKTEKWIQEYGYWIVLANRFLPGIRSVISIVSGISGLNKYRVFIISLISALIWNLIWIHIGFLLGNKWSSIKEKFKDLMMNYNIIAIIIIALFAIIFIVLKYRKRKNNSPA